MKKQIALLTILAVFFSSCATTQFPTKNYTYPHDGVTNNVGIASKDFESAGIIFVKSVEVIDTEGNHTGSKITYEMLMQEAAKLGADDVINIKIDVNQKEEKLRGTNGITITKITYSYTASALAIRYTNALGQADDTKKAASLSNKMIIPGNEVTEKSKSKAGPIILASLLVVAAVVGIGFLISTVADDGKSNDSYGPGGSYGYAYHY